VKTLSLPWLYYGLAISQALHSIEEVLAQLWAWMPRVTESWHSRLGWIPVMQGMGEKNFAATNLLIVAGLLALLPFVFERRPWALTLAFWIAIIEILNGGGHLAAALVVRGYFPGVLTGIGLMVFGILYVRSFLAKKQV
jgi:hypothetical protein